MSAGNSTSWILTADAKHMPTIRDNVIKELTDWGYALTSVNELDLRLVTSELVTNGIVHAGGDIVVTLWAEDSEAYIEVQDTSPEKPCIRTPADGDEHGRGLLLVETLSIDWGTDLLKDGKRVWARVRLYTAKKRPARAEGRHLGIVRAAFAGLWVRLLSTA